MCLQGLVLSLRRAWPGLRGLDGLRLHLEVETGSLKGLNDSRVQCVVTDHFNFFFFLKAFLNSFILAPQKDCEAMVIFPFSAQVQGWA